MHSHKTHAHNHTHAPSIHARTHTIYTCGLRNGTRNFEIDFFCLEYPKNRYVLRRRNPKVINIRK